MEQKPANTALRSQYSLRLYSRAKKYVEDGVRNNFTRGTPTRVRLGIDQGCGEEYHSESALAGLAELPATGA
jgi:hypothetical protein